MIRYPDTAKNKDLIKIKKFAWILSGGIEVPGSRIHGINIHSALLEYGIRSEIIRMPKGFREKLQQFEISRLLTKIEELKSDIVVFQKVNGSNAVKLCKILNKLGVYTVFIACDSVDERMARQCDLTFAVSSYLKNLFNRKNRKKIRVLQDPIEVPKMYRNREIVIPKKGRLKGVYLSSQFPDKVISALLAVCQDFLDVSIISSPPDKCEHTGRSSIAPKIRVLGLLKEHRSRIFFRVYNKILCYLKSKKEIRDLDLSRKLEFQFIEWELDSVYQNISKHHIGLLPIYMDSTFKRSKSANRMATLMALGLATIASPLPSYLENAIHGKTILFAHNPSEWRRWVQKLDRDRDFALALALEGRKHAWEQFSRESILSNFLKEVTCGIKAKS